MVTGACPVISGATVAGHPLAKQSSHLLVAFAASLALTTGARTAAADEAAAAAATPADEEAAVAATAATSPSRWAVVLGGVAAWRSPPVRGGTTPFGAGFGGRLGTELSHLSLGGRVIGFLGGDDVGATSRSVLYGGELGYGFDVNVSSTSYFTFRPRVGVGGVTFIHTEPATAAAATTSARASTSRTRSAVVTDTVDILAGASRRSSSSSSSSSTPSSSSSLSSPFSSSGSGSSSDTSTASSFYVEPGVSVIFASRASTPYVGIDACVLVVPRVEYGGSEPSTWISFGLGGELGLRF
jgi:hypothetical protein